MKITLKFGLKDLPDWVNINELSNCGSGKEYASYLIIEDGEYKAIYSDAMEPEDATFGRDLHWIVTELRRVADKNENRSNQ